MFQLNKRWSGVYGFSKLDGFAGRDATLRKFEKFTLDHQGFQALYAETLMSREEFCHMFPRQIYDKVGVKMPFKTKVFLSLHMFKRRGMWIR